MEIDWKVIRKIGKGGNGTVFEIEDSEGNRFAKKVLKNIRDKKAYLRFKSEIEVLTHLKDFKGIVPILDFFIPRNPEESGNAYYIMPLGISFVDYIKGINNEDLFKLIFDLGETLEAIHKLEITHRDIKPENLLIIDGKPVFSDFGLANFPKKKKVSSPNERIGAKRTIAPEMERISSTADFKRADIYSFAKTLWMLITKEYLGFEGQYIPNSSISIDKYVEIMINKPKIVGKWYYKSLVLLDQLLVDCTDNDPLKRPNAENLNQGLKYWYKTNDEYGERNPYEWVDALRKIFPISIPDSCSWNKAEDIVKVLDILCSQYDNLNHAFYPDMGGNDFSIVQLGNSGTIIINNDILIKPKVLYFEFMNDFDWSYFRLELLEQEKNDLGQLSEYYDEVSLNVDGDVLSRYLKGSFIITKKTSWINQLSGHLDAYMSYHNKLSNEEYKELLVSARKIKIDGDKPN